MKRLLLLFFLVCCIAHIKAKELSFEILSENEKNTRFYVGINPLSLIAFLPNPIGVTGTGFGILSGQEFGISIYGGMYFAKSHSIEMRFSTGPGSLEIWDTQLQAGYIWYPLEQFKERNGGLNIGFMARQFFWNNRITDSNIFNLTPELLVGWRFNAKSLAFDVRAGWNIASVTWSDIPNTKTGIGWITFPYGIALTTGIVWVF